MSFIESAVNLIFANPVTQKIGNISIDIVSQRSISEKTNVTNNPTEKGFVTDNARDEPTEISITGIISSYSLNKSTLSSISSLAAGKIPNRLIEVHNELYRIKNDKEPIILKMKYKIYENMFLTSLDMPADAGDGDSFRFTANFKEIKIATSQLISVDNTKIKKDSAKKQSNFGRQSTTTKTAAVPDAVKPDLTLTQFVKELF